MWLFASSSAPAPWKSHRAPTNQVSSRLRTVHARPTEKRIQGAHPRPRGWARDRGGFHILPRRPSLFARLERGELSVAVSFPGHEGLGSRLLFPLCALGVISLDHRFGRRATVEVAELAQERLLLLSRQFLRRQWFDTACQRAHLRPTVLLESTAPHALIALARVGYGTLITQRPGHPGRGHRPHRPLTRVAGRWHSRHLA